MDNNSVNNFEKFPGANPEVSSENLEKAKGWEMAMSGETGGEVPVFKGDKYGIAKEENNYYGETIADEAENKYDSELAEASSILNFGLDSMARTIGVEATISLIKGADVNGSEDPIGDLMRKAGIDTKTEVDDLKDESEANVSKVAETRREVNTPSHSTSVEAARNAILEMKELISEVEGADPKYDALRAGAKSAGMGYFEYAIKDYGTRGLAELFQVLAEQGKEEKSNETTENNEDVIENNEELVVDDSEAEEKNKEGLSNIDDGKWNKTTAGIENGDELNNRERLNPEILKQQ